MEDLSSGILCLPRVRGEFIVTAPDCIFENFFVSRSICRGGCLLMVLMRAYNRWCYCLGHSVESKMDLRICIGLAN